nr:MAG TPA: hypothetical protein [Caudoviricetes sp.]
MREDMDQNAGEVSCPITLLNRGNLKNLFRVK